MRSDIACLTLGIILLWTAPSIGHPADDAALYAVQFVDAREGWAVGDQGTIWHTIDGGQTWERQTSGISAQLRAVHFVDAFHGYAVGLECGPTGRDSVGVVLRTEDGGVRWTRATDQVVPALFAVRFVDRQRGLAAGSTSPLYPSGVLATTDGGQTWRPVLAEPQPWLSLAWHKDHVLLTGPRGTWQPLRRLLPLPLRTTPSPASILAVHMHGRSAWVAGQGGLVGLLEDIADEKVQLQAILPDEVRDAWDFHAMAWHDDRGWLVGRPGSVVLHTWDGGRSWQTFSTGQPVPLHGLFFLDDNRGWAVGDLGLILHTDDGGRTWRVQKRGAQRIAVMCITSNPHLWAAPVLAELGQQHGYLCHLLVVGAEESDRGVEDALWRLHTRRLGGCLAEIPWPFVKPDYSSQARAADWASHWGGNESLGLHKLERHLTLALRIWRPDVVVTDAPDPRQPSGSLGGLVALCAQRAYQSAARADKYSEQITRLDLAPWSAAKLYAYWTAPEEIQVQLSPASYRAGLLIWDAQQSSPEREPLRSATSPVKFRLLDARLPDAATHTALMQGVASQPGGQNRREASDTSRAAQLPDRHREDNSCDQWLEMQRPVHTDREGQALLDETRKRLHKDKDADARAAWLLAQMHLQAGEWLMARELFLLLVDRFPEHPLAPEAYRWLIQYSASSEARRRTELGQMISQVRYEFEPAAEEHTESVPKRRRSPVVVQADGGTALVRRKDEIRNWDRAAIALADCLAAFGKEAYQDPRVQFPLRAAQRRLGQVQSAKAWLAQFAAAQGTGPWYQAARAELWLEERKGPPPKPLWMCRRASQPPYLDGLLDDACWKEATFVTLEATTPQVGRSFPAQAALAWDDKYLYVALTCDHPAGLRLPPVSPRPRDPDLRSFDRVYLLLDVDRDYATYYRLEMDQRGCVAEDCWGDSKWNPRWFVCVSSQENRWQIEAAIPLTELVSQPIKSGDCWCVNAVRIVPNQGLAAFAFPAAVRPKPEGMGLLLFQ
ncbi:MAG: hypothetical protein C4296_09220 [Gemmataceae bacterium]